RFHVLIAYAAATNRTMARASPIVRPQAADPVGAQKRAAVLQKRLRRLRCLIASWLASSAGACNWCPDRGRMRGIVSVSRLEGFGTLHPIWQGRSVPQQRRLRSETRSNAWKFRRPPLASRLSSCDGIVERTVGDKVRRQAGAGADAMAARSPTPCPALGFLAAGTATWLRARTIGSGGHVGRFPPKVPRPPLLFRVPHPLSLTEFLEGYLTAWPAQQPK